MDVFLAALGMLACIAIMGALMPLGMRVARRIRDTTAKHPHHSSTSQLIDPSPTGDPSPGGDQAPEAHDSKQERG
jgi:hypothetical protein